MLGSGNLNELHSAPELNAELEDRLRTCRLVFELLDENTVASIASAVDWLKEQSHDLPALLAERYPALLTCHLVSEVIGGYTAGALWPTFSFVRNQKDQELIGGAFLRTLRTNGLETFDFLSAQGLRFVTPILAHAGMPRYCLEDFFKLLLRELEKGFGGTASELLATWRARKTSFVGVDRPVERFLLFGGETAVDLLDRCIDLLAETAHTGVVPDVEAAVLPRHVVEAFREGWIKEGRKSVSFSSARVAVPPPVVRIDPWDPLGPVFELPVVPASLKSESWTIESGAGIETLGASLLQMQQRRLLPARHWSAALSRRGEKPRTFVFEWLPETGVAAFDPSSGILARDPRAIAWSQAWLLHPNETTVEGRGRDGRPVRLRRTQELPAPVGAWTGYSLAEYDLAEVAALTITRNTAGGTPTQESIRVLHATAGRPSLDGAPVVDVRTDIGLPVYATPPVLRFPASMGRAWRVRLRVGDRTIERTVEDQSELSLDDLVSDFKVACVQLSATGPIGMDLRESFGLVRGLSVRRPSRLVLPKDLAWVELHAGPGVRLANSTERVSLPPGADSISCEVTDSGGSLTLVASVPRLIWAVTKPGASSPHQFDTREERISLDELGSGEDWGGALSVSTRCPGLALRLELADPGGGCLQQSTPQTTSARDGRALFHLAAFRDTAITSGAASLRLNLSLIDLPARVQVGELHARVHLSEMRVSQTSTADGSSSFEVSFEEAVHFRRREMRLWSQGRPWEAAPIVSLDLPDDVTQHVVLRSPADAVLPPGRYLAEIGIKDGWTAPTRPHRRAPNTVGVVVGGPASHRERLTARANADPLAVLELLLDGGTLVRPLSRAEVRTVGKELVAAVASLRSGDLGDERVRDALIGVLRSQPDHAVRALVSGRESLTTSAALKLGVRLLPFASVETDDKWEEGARQCWTTCPPLAAQIDVPLATRGAEEALARCREFLGWEVTEWPVTVVAPKRSEFAPQQALLGIDTGLLSSLRQACVLAPSALLARDEYAEVGFEWLLEKRRVQDWMDEFDELLLTDLTSAERLGIESREPHAGTVNLARFPQLTLIAALILVRSAGVDDALSKLARQALVAAASFAPRLVAFDLTLASILPRWQPPEPRCSTP
jgi:hypothetical protein